MADLLLEKLYLSSIELIIVVFLAFLILKLFRIKSARLCSLIWIVVMIKPVIGLFSAAPLNVKTLEKPDYLTWNIFQDYSLVLEQNNSHNFVETDERKSSNIINRTENTIIKESPVNKAKGDSPVSSAGNTKSFPDKELTVSSIMLIVWGAGVGVLLILFIKGYLMSLKMLKKSTSSPSAKTLKIFDEISKEIGVNPKVLICSEIQSPAVFGFFSPNILLPGWLEKDGNEDKLRWILRHELTHCKLRDPFCIFIKKIATSIFFFHPFIWFAARKWEEYMELACDRAMLKSEEDAYKYADSLYKILEYIKEDKPMKLQDGLYATRTQIGKRIAVLLSGAVKYPAKLGAAGICLFSLVAALTLSSGLNIASASGDEDNKYEGMSIEEKSEKVQTDLRSIATSFEAYFVDHNEYPDTTDKLISPISYINKIPVDPFGYSKSQATYKYFLEEKSGDRYIYSVGPNGKDELAKGDDICRLIKYKDIVPYNTGNEEKEKSKLLETNLSHLETMVRLYTFKTGKYPTSIDEVLFKLSYLGDKFQKYAVDPFDPSKNLTLSKGNIENEVFITSVGSGSKIEFRFTLQNNILDGYETENYKSHLTSYVDELKKFGNDNSMLYYIMASKLFEEFSAQYHDGCNPLLSSNSLDSALNPACRESWNDDFQILTLYFETLEPILELVHTGRLMDKSINVEQRGPDTPVPNFLGIQLYTKLLTARANYNFSIGNTDQAVSDLLDVIVCGSKFRGKNAILISQLIGVADEKIGLRMASIIVSSGKLNEEQIKLIQDTLIKIDESEKNVGNQLVNSELLCMQIAFNSIFNELAKKHGDEAKYYLGEFISEEFDEKAIIQNKDQIMEEMTWLYTENGRILNMPYEQIEKEGLYNEFTSKMEDIFSHNVLAGQGFPNFRDAYIRCMITKAYRRILIFMTALEIKKLNSNPIPTEGISGDDLGLAESLCKDPFMIDSSPGYWSDGESYKIWCAGPDLKNDNMEITYDPTNGTISNGDIFY